MNLILSRPSSTLSRYNYISISQKSLLIVTISNTNFISAFVDFNIYTHNSFNTLTSRVLGFHSFSDLVINTTSSPLVITTTTKKKPTIVSVYTSYSLTTTFFLPSSLTLSTLTPVILLPTRTYNLWRYHLFSVPHPQLISSPLSLLGINFMILHLNYFTV